MWYDWQGDNSPQDTKMTQTLATMLHHGLQQSAKPDPHSLI